MSTDRHFFAVHIMSFTLCLYCAHAGDFFFFKLRIFNIETSNLTPNPLVMLDVVRSSLLV